MVEPTREAVSTVREQINRAFIFSDFVMSQPYYRWTHHISKCVSRFNYLRRNDEQTIFG